MTNATQQRVLVVMQGGVIQDVVVPAGVTVEVRDYDVDDCDDVHTDDNGDHFVRTFWEGGAE